jgi:hypothetical protein
MFLWNMLGALVLLPALASFILPKKLFSPGRLSPVSAAVVENANV